MSGKYEFRDQVVAATGLSSVFAISVIERACKRAQVSPDTLDARGLTQALDSLEMALKLYLSPEELPVRVAALRAIARGRAA